MITLHWLEGESFAVPVGLVRQPQLLRDRLNAVHVEESAGGLRCHLPARPVHAILPRPNGGAPRSEVVGTADLVLHLDHTGLGVMTARIAVESNSESRPTWTDLLYRSGSLVPPNDSRIRVKALSSTAAAVVDGVFDDEDRLDLPRLRRDAVTEALRRLRPSERRARVEVTWVTIQTDTDSREINTRQVGERRVFVHQTHPIARDPARTLDTDAATLCRILASAADSSGVHRAVRQATVPGTPAAQLSAARQQLYEARRTLRQLWRQAQRTEGPFAEVLQALELTDQFESLDEQLTMLSDELATSVMISVLHEIQALSEEST